MYWERREDRHNFLVSSMISKNESEECKKYLYLSDNNNLHIADRLAQARPLFSSINQQCLLNYQPTKHISVDESMMPYFGKPVPTTIFMGNSKYGCKLCVMATLLSYCIQFRPYAGKDTILQEYAGIDLGLVVSVKAHLVGDSNYHIIMDNFFTSPELMRHLSSKQIAATGTVRTNRMKMYHCRFR